MMSKKDYEWVAATIKEEVVLVAMLTPGSEMRRSASESLQNVATKLSKKFAAANTRFDEHRFMRACGFTYDPDLDGEWFVPVSKKQKVTSIYDGSKVTCRECGNDEFFSVGRSLDYNNWKCSECGAECCTLTETGASR
jgi:hypothetical protein